MPDELDQDPPEAAEPPAARLPREPLLDQGEIDAALGFRASPPVPEGEGVRAMLHAGATPREKLPMLPVVFGELARRLSSSLRGLLGDEVQVDLASLATVRFTDLLDGIVLPAQVVTFRADPWNGRGLVALGPDFARLVLDRLLGAARALGGGRVAARPFSAIETAILTRLADAILREAESAFSPVAPVGFRREETSGDPRLAEIAAPGESTVEAVLTLQLGARTAAFALALPFATIEPVRGALARRFAGAKGGGDDLWSGHLASEIWQASLEAEAVLHETAMPLGRVLDLAVGDTLMFDMKPNDLVEVRCAGHAVMRGRLGRVEGRVAVQVVETLRSPEPAAQETPSP